MDEKDLMFIQGTKDYYDRIVKLCDECFGTGYVDEREYEKWLLHPGLFNIALANGRFAGFSVMLPASAHEIMRHMGMEQEEVQALTDGRPAVIYKSVAVCPAYRQNGLLKGLVQDLVKNAKEMGIGSVFLSAWTYQGKTPVEKALNACGFTRLYVRKMLWYSYENYKCILCHGRCKCDAVIYHKSLG